MVGPRFPASRGDARGGSRLKARPRPAPACELRSGPGFGGKAAAPFFLLCPQGLSVLWFSVVFAVYAKRHQPPCTVNTPRFYSYLVPSRAVASGVRHG